MAELVHWETKEMPAVRVVGQLLQVSMEELENDNPIPRKWEQCFADGTMSTLDSLREFAVDPNYVGWMGEWNPATKEFLYIIGMLVRPGTLVPEGFGHRDQEACHVFVGWIKGKESEIFGSAHSMTEEAMAEHGYVYDDHCGWSMELYQCPRFTQPDADGQIILDYYMPVVKASTPS